METRKQQQDRAAREQLLTTMDPKMKAGFDSISASLSDSITSAVTTAMAAAFHDTNLKLDGVLLWRSDLDARITDLQNSVVELRQKTSVTSGDGDPAVAPATSLGQQFEAAAAEVGGADHGLGHGVVYTIGGFPQGPQAAPPVTGPLDFSTPMKNNSDTVSSSQVFQSLGQTPPL